MFFDPIELRQAVKDCYAKTDELRPFLNGVGPAPSLMAGFMIGLLVRYWHRQGQPKESLLATVEQVWGDSSTMQPGDKV
jgi:hypothetical protein